LTVDANGVVTMGAHVIGRLEGLTADRRVEALLAVLAALVAQDPKTREIVERFAATQPC
jgi:hypothetical protein